MLMVCRCTWKRRAGVVPASIKFSRRHAAAILAEVLICKLHHAPPHVSTYNRREFHQQQI